MDKNAKICYIVLVKRGVYMRIHDGNLKDVTDFSTDKYLKINSCGFQNAESPFTVVRKNGRKDYLILLISQGKSSVLHNSKTFDLSAGNFLIYAPGEEQKYSFETNTSSMWCHFSGRILEELFEECNLQSGVYYTSNNAVLEAFSNLIRNFNTPSQSKLAIVYLLELIYSISSAITSPEPAFPDALLSVISYINENYNKTISLDTLAKISGYSKSRFSHIFSEYMNTTPIRYQNEIRLRNASEMLTSTHLSVSDIAISCGFSDPLYFSRVFRKKYNITPTDYRK